MKKILLLILGISFFSFASIAQSQTEIVYQDSKIKVEMIKQDCNYHNQAISHTYGFLKYTNLTQNLLSVKFDLDLWYNGIKEIQTQGDLTNEQFEKSIELGPNETISGDCQSRNNSLFKIIVKNNHPKVNIELTDINFVINKIK